MQRPLRDLARDAAIYGAGDILLRATALITLPIYTRVFDPQQYGVLNFVQTAMGLVAAVLILGGDVTFARFFLAARDTGERRLVTSTWLGFLALWSGLASLILLPFAAELSLLAFDTDQYTLLFTLALLAAPLTLLNTMCGQALRNQFRPREFSILSVGGSLLSIVFSLYGVLVLQLGLAGLLGGALAAAALMLPLRLWAIRDLLRPVWSPKLLRELLAFGAPIVPSSLAYWIFASSDRFVLARLSTLEQLGLYSIATGIIGVLSFANGAIGQAWTPHATRLYEQRNPMAPAFFGQVLTYLLVGFGILGVGLTVFAPEGLLLLTTPQFYPAAAAIGPLTLAVTAHVSQQVTGAAIGLTKRTHYYAICSWLAALLNLGLNIIFVPAGGMLAAAWTTTAAYLFLTLAYLAVSQRLWPIAYEVRRGLPAIVLTVVFTLGAPLLPDAEFALRIALKLGYCLLFLLLLVACGALGRREWAALQRMLRRA
jgi:O-antigen/teichoic acid export membrane protein